MLRAALFSAAVLLALGPASVRSETVAAQAQLLRTAVAALCPRPDLLGLEAQEALPGAWLVEDNRRDFGRGGSAVVLRLAVSGPEIGVGEVKIERRTVGDSLRQFRVSFFQDQGDGPTPAMLAIADGACTIQSGRAMRSEGPAWRFLDQLDGDLHTLRWTETLQAPWPDGVDPGGVRVGLIDSGLAYDLDLFRDRLARDADGVPLGYDFWDLDPWPYDGDVSRGPFLPIRHGTAVASVLVREAPDAALVPYRYPRPDMSRLGDIVTRAAADGVRILAMPLGSRKPEDWTTFAAALEEHDILAVVSAGNDGRDIDADPVYPAALPAERILTVTSADGFGRLAQGSNWGATHVDLMLPAENLEVTDFRGARGSASGSSYAVPRLAAMAARLLAAEPALSADALKARLMARAAPSPFESEDRLAVGWIANPLDDN